MQIIYFICTHTHTFIYFCSSNVTVEGSSCKITTEAAKEVLRKAPEPLEPQSVEPIGKLCK